MDTGSCSYLTGLGCTLGCTASFSGTAALNDSGASTTLTLTVGSVSGATTGISSGAFAFAPASAIQDQVGNGATAAGNVATTTGFKLF